jgi:diphthamide synthase (EF-2-diphthine--ammonia ligase)
MKILVSWSTGKDSAWMLHRLRAQHPGAIGGLLSTTNQAVDRVAMHGVRRSVLEAQASAARLPLTLVPLPWPCSNEEYEARMSAAVAAKVREGFTHVAFGDLFLEDVRRYREERLAGSGLAPLFPLWRTMPTRRLADEMIAGGLRATLTCVDTRVLLPSFAGRQFNAALLADLPEGVDPCGENGEFHTCAWDGPMFAGPLVLAAGEVVTRDSFVFADLSLAAATDATP